MSPSSRFLQIVFLFLALGESWSFVAPSTSVKQGVNAKSSSSSLMASPEPNQNGKSPMAASILAAAFIFSNVAAPAMAITIDDYNNQHQFEPSSSQVIAARSGGRMGGRSSMGSRGSMGSSRGPTTTNIRRTTVVRPAVSSPTVIVAPPMYSPFGVFSPFSPFGFGFGMGNGIGGSYRDYRQDDEIARERTELEQARLRQAELEQRIAQLEGRTPLPLQEQEQQQLQPAGQ